MDKVNLQNLRMKAQSFADELSKHIVLQKYWNKLSLIMKGSTARGYSDKYSDIDFVIFTNEETKNNIVSEYISNGLSNRQDGVFLPLNAEWEGHYNLDTYENLGNHFIAGDMVSVWEYSNVVIMHDAENYFKNIIDKSTKILFDDIDKLIMKKYIEIQLYLDWMRQPLRRADICASIQYAAHFQRYCSHIMYLLNNEGYPPDKWLFFYLKKTNMSDELYLKIINYSKVICTMESLEPDMELAEYSAYSHATIIIEEIMTILKNRYGMVQWIDKWYLYA